MLPGSKMHCDVVGRSSGFGSVKSSASIASGPPFFFLLLLLCYFFCCASQGHQWYMFESFLDHQFYFSKSSSLVLVQLLNLWIWFGWWSWSCFWMQKTCIVTLILCFVTGDIQLTALAHISCWCHLLAAFKVKFFGPVSRRGRHGDPSVVTWPHVM